jgi:hypothetical protein
MAVAATVKDAKLLRLPVDGLEVVDFEGNMLELGGRRIPLEEMELQVAEAEPLQRRPEVGSGDLLHPEKVAVKLHRLCEIGGTYAHVVETDGSHDSRIS